MQEVARPWRVVIGSLPGDRGRSPAKGGDPLRGRERAAAGGRRLGCRAHKERRKRLLALKLSFVNEVASLSEEYGVDVEEVLTGIGLDPRIGTDYMRPCLGFGGSCLPRSSRCSPARAAEPSPAATTGAPAA